MILTCVRVILFISKYTINLFNMISKLTNLVSELLNINVLKENRLPWVDYAKGIAIILVVYRHVLGGYNNAGINVPDYLILVQQSIYNFRMPLFFILAGIFVRKSLAKRSLGNFFYYKLNTVLYPYFIWAFIQLTSQIVFSNYANSDKTISNYLFLFYRPSELDQFWFLYTLFNVTMLFSLVQKWQNPPAIYHLIYGVIFYFISTFPEMKLYGGTLITDTLNYYIYFAIGSAISEILLSKKNQKILSSNKGLLIISPLFILSQWYWISNPALKDKEPFTFAIIAIIGSAFLLNISFILGKINKLKILRIIGNHSLYIYIMHVLVLAFSRAILIKVFNINHIGILLTSSIIISTIIPIIGYNLLQKLGLWFLFRFRNPNTSKPIHLTDPKTVNKDKVTVA